MNDDWEPRPSLLRRWLIPAGETGERPALVAFLVGAVGTVAFAGSLVLDWANITMEIPRDYGQGGFGPGDEISGSASLSNVDMLGQVYIIGAIALLGLLGTVLTRPAAAVRMRMTVAGLGFGLAAVVVAMVLRLPESSVAYVNFVSFGGPAAEEQLARSLHVAYEPGVFCGAAAVVLLVLGVWLAGRPAARAAAVAVEPRPTRTYVPEPAAEPEPVPDRQWAGPVGRVDELTVFRSEPVDPTATPDGWGR